MLKALRPCSFDGHQFWIGDTVPDSLVLDARKQERWGVLKILPDEDAQDAGTAEAPAEAIMEDAQDAGTAEAPAEAIMEEAQPAGTAEAPAEATMEEARPAAKATRKKARKKAADGQDV